jgi:hypothetical protein
MKATLTKWDAAVVGETPPLGRWMKFGQQIKVTTKQPHRYVRRLARVLGYEWVPGVDRNTPGCLEVIEINPGQAPDVWSRP